MGYFDDSDEDDEQPTAAHHLKSKDNDAAGDDEDDPLDAYMKTLDQNEPSKTDNKINDCYAAFDEDEDADGATNKDYQLNGESIDDIGDSESWSSQRKAAKQALENTFRKAGSSKQDNFVSSSQSPTAMPPPTTNSTPFTKCFWQGRDTTVGRNWRRDHQVVLDSMDHRHRRSGQKAHGVGHDNNTTSSSTTVAMDPILHFSELQDVFGSGLMHEIERQNFTAPTLVQSQTLPIALAGYNAIVTAATGQGKTLAYLWPILVHVMHQPPLQAPHETGPLALVLVPTRELALQVHKQCKPMLSAAAASAATTTTGSATSNSNNASNLSCRAVIGGQGKYLLRQELKKAGGVHVVIATPGRLLDVASDAKGLSLQRVTFVVLDEADKMLQMGFEAQVRQILQQIRPDRQTLMLSATMGLRVEKVAQEWLYNSRNGVGAIADTTTTPVVRISVGRTGEASQNVEQHVMVLPNEGAKETFLLEMLPTLSQVGRTVVFVATRENCERLATLVRESATATSPSTPTTVLTLHGDKHQSDRTAAVRAFTKGDVNVLIATDVAARGLDIPNIQTILSFDPAKNLDSHVHRVGRAGRLSKETNQQQLGSAYTLLTPKNADFANILKSAFEREGRTVSPELLQLSQRSRRQSQVGNSRTHANKSGLGFVSSDGDGTTRPAYAAAAVATHFDSALAPPEKRSRWT